MGKIDTIPPKKMHNNFWKPIGFMLRQFTYWNLSSVAPISKELKAKVKGFEHDLFDLGNTHGNLWKKMLW